MTYLLRLSACLFLSVSLNSFGAILYGFDGNQNIIAHEIAANQRTFLTNNYGGGQNLSFTEDGGFTYGDGFLYGFDGNQNIIAHEIATNQRTFLTDNYGNGQNLSFTEDGGFTYAPSSIPLPASIYLFLSGLVGLGLMRGRNA